MESPGAYVDNRVLRRHFRRRVDNLSFFEYLSPFFFKLNFNFLQNITKFCSLLFYLDLVVISCLLFLLLYFPRDQSRDVTLRLGEGDDF